MHRKNIIFLNYARLLKESSPDCTFYNSVESIPNEGWDQFLKSPNIDIKSVIIHKITIKLF